MIEYQSIESQYVSINIFFIASSAFFFSSSSISLDRTVRLINTHAASPFSVGSDSLAAFLDQKSTLVEDQCKAMHKQMQDRADQQKRR